MFDQINKYIFASIKSEPPLMKPGAIPTCSVIGYQEEEMNTSLSAFPRQETAESNEVTLQSLFSQTT